MVIKKRGIKSLCDILSDIVGPFCFYDTEDRLLYESAGFKPSPDTKNKNYRYDISLEGIPVGYVNGEIDRLDTAASLIGLYLKNIKEIRGLTTHTLHKYKELNLFSELSEIMSSSIDINEVFSSVAAKIRRIIEAENCSVMMVDTKGDRFQLRAVSERVVRPDTYLDLSQGIAGKVVKTGKSIIVNETDKYPDFVRGGRGQINSILCIPLKIKDKTVGVLNLSNKKSGMFTTEDESLLSSISIMLAGVIENARLLEEKIKSEKFTAIGQMAAGIIHDIKNPMTTIKGFAALLGDMEFTKEERKEYSTMIVGEVERLVTMVEDILAFSRGSRTRLELTRISVERFFSDIISYIEKDMTPRKIEVVVRLDYRDDFNIDTDRFKRVIFNIAGNAREVMCRGGRLLILTRQEDGKVEILLSDTGTGIPEDIISTVFEPFVTKGKKTGTGLGLAVTKKIVEEHGGSITAVNGNYSGVSGFNGANFIIRLPI